ncbi:MAG: LLM class flavin-dependent oxidoreductase [Candidatus Thorarchaeota archaeon]|nr:MAG: LLM class flavin-dependent oxidoreductase [Candidatus Thorarchaeota archaeon]
MYRASVGITTNMKAKATNWIADNASSLGIETIWIGEDIDIGQDVFVLTACVLLRAQEARVGTAIIPVTVHNISTLARAALTLQEIGQGRFVFGTGIGGIQDLQRLGITLKRPVTDLKAAVSVLRRLWIGDSVTVENELFTLQDYSLRIRKSKAIPVFLGVRGPKMLELAGLISDGVILSGPFDYLKNAVGTIDSAAMMAGRKDAEVEKVAWLPTVPTFKGVKESLAKRVVSIVVADMPEAVLDMLDVDRGRVDKIRTSVEVEGPDGGIPYVNDELLDMFSISGDRDHMVDRFEELSKIGISEVVLGPPFSGDWRGAMKDIFQEIHRRRD